MHKFAPILLFLIGCAASNGVSEPSITVSEHSAQPGDAVQVTAAGFPPNTEVVVGAGPPESEYDVLQRVRTTTGGEVNVSVTVPQYASDNRTLVFVVATPDNQTKVISDKVMITGEGGSVTITGTVTDEGVECPAVRTPDRQLYTIATSDRSKLQPGARVRITGTIAEMSFCQQGTTISATNIEVL